MSGYRKVFLGTIYMLGVFALSWKSGVDLIGVAAIATGTATGLGVIVWGNRAEHQARGSQDATKT